MPVNIVDIPMPNLFTQGIGILPPSEKNEHVAMPALFDVWS